MPGASRPAEFDTTPEADAPILRLTNVTHRYEELTALSDFSITVRRGEMFGLIGPDGAGKTTALRLGLGLLSPGAGEVRTFGVDPFRSRRRLSQRIGYLSQRFSIYGDLSIDENVAFFARAHEVRNWQPRREQLLQRLDLARFRTRLAERLSGGMKQKLALACTLMHTPELLVLDEPTTGVDPVSRREFWRILSELQREGMTLVITTPYLDEAERCHRVGLVERGHLLVVDEPRNLRGSLGGSMLEILAYPRQEAQELLRAHPEVANIETFGERIHAALPAVPRDMALSRAGAIAGHLTERGIQVHSVRPVEPSLEDVFIAKLKARHGEEGNGGGSEGSGGGGSERSGGGDGSTSERDALVKKRGPGWPGRRGKGRRGGNGPHFTMFVAVLAAVSAWAAAPASASDEPPFASTGDSLRLTLAEALARALASAPRLRQLEALHESALGGTKEARSAGLPQVAASAGYTRLSEEKEFSLTTPTGEDIGINPNLPDRWRTRLGVSWPLWTAGRVSASVDASEHAATAAQRDVDAGTRDLELEATQAYWRVVTERERLRVLAEAVRTYDAHALDVQHRLDVGLAARNDLLAIQVERDRADLTRLEVENQATTAEENLQRLLGVAVPIRTVDPLRTAVPGTGLGPGFTPEPAPRPAPRAPSGSGEFTDSDVADLQNAALAERPERDALRARFESAEARRRMERSGYWPQLSLAGGWDYARPSSRVFPLEDRWEDSWDAGLYLSWTLFDAGRTAGAMERTRGQAQALRAQLKDLDDRIRLEVASRARDLETARAAVQVAERAVESARENVLVSRDRYREGVLSSSELLDAETSLLQASLDRTQALARERVAEAALAHAVGQELVPNAELRP